MNKPEALTCPNCGHVFETIKTVGKPGNISLTCPKCKAKSDLSSYREPQPVETEPPQIDITDPTVKSKTPAPPAPKSALESLKESIIPISLMFVGIAGVFVMFGCTASLLSSLAEVDGPKSYERFQDDVANGKTANEIQKVRAELSFIRSAIILYFTTRFTVWCFRRAVSD